MSGQTAYFTICARNYLSYARTLQQSLSASDPGTDFFICLADSSEGVSHEAPDGSKVLSLDDLNIDCLKDMAFKYSVLEFCTSIKPHCFQHLFQKLNYERVIYLDPDILVLRPLEHVHRALEDGASCILTPHITQPLPDGGNPSDIDILRAGIFNLGFAAFRNDPAAFTFLDWWRAACERSCYVKMERGYFVDQKFCNLAPCFIPDLLQLNHPGYNLAYWNLPHRKVTLKNGEYFANDETLHFVHFSGVDVNDVARFSKYQNRYLRKDLGDLGPLYDSYIEKLKANDVVDGIPSSRMKYAFNHFKNGEQITRAMRRQYADLIETGSGGKDPFELGAEFFRAQPPEATERIILSRALLSPAFMLRGLIRRLVKGRERTLRYWEKRVGTLAEE